MITADEYLVVVDRGIDCTVCVRRIINFSIEVGVETSWMLGIVNGIRAVFENNAVAGQTNNALDDIFVLHACLKSRVFKDDHLTALWLIGVALDVRPRDRKSVDDQAIAGIKRRLHAWAGDRETTKQKDIDQPRANDDCEDEADDAEDVSECFVGVEGRGVHPTSIHAFR